MEQSQAASQDSDQDMPHESTGPELREIDGNITADWQPPEPSSDSDSDDDLPILSYDWQRGGKVASGGVEVVKGKRSKLLHSSKFKNLKGTSSRRGLTEVLPEAAIEKVKDDLQPVESQCLSRGQAGPKSGMNKPTVRASASWQPRVCSYCHMTGHRADNTKLCQKGRDLPGCPCWRKSCGGCGDKTRSHTRACARCGHGEESELPKSKKARTDKREAKVLDSRERDSHWQERRQDDDAEGNQFEEHDQRAEVKQKTGRRKAPPKEKARTENQITESAFATHVRRDVDAAHVEIVKSWTNMLDDMALVGGDPRQQLQETTSGYKPSRNRKDAGYQAGWIWQDHPDNPRNAKKSLKSRLENGWSGEHFNPVSSEDLFTDEELQEMPRDTLLKHAFLNFTPYHSRKFEWNREDGGQAKNKKVQVTGFVNVNLIPRIYKTLVDRGLIERQRRPTNAELKQRPTEDERLGEIREASARAADQFWDAHTAAIGAGSALPNPVSLHGQSSGQAAVQLGKGHVANKTEKDTSAEQTATQAAPKVESKGIWKERLSNEALSKTDEIAVAKVVMRKMLRNPHARELICSLGAKKVMLLQEPAVSLLAAFNIGKLLIEVLNEEEFAEVADKLLDEAFKRQPTLSEASSGALDMQQKIETVGEEHQRLCTLLEESEQDRHKLLRVLKGYDENIEMIQKEKMATQAAVSYCRVLQRECLVKEAVQVFLIPTTAPSSLPQQDVQMDQAAQQSSPVQPTKDRSLNGEQPVSNSAYGVQIEGDAGTATIKKPNGTEPVDGAAKSKPRKRAGRRHRRKPVALQRGGVEPEPALRHQQPARSPSSPTDPSRPNPHLLASLDGGFCVAELEPKTHKPRSSAGGLLASSDSGLHATDVPMKLETQRTSASGSHASLDCGVHAVGDLLVRSVASDKGGRSQKGDGDAKDTVSESNAGSG